MDASPYRICDLVLDAGSLAKRSPEIEQERRVAVADLLQQNYFAPNGSEGGPYRLVLGLADNRLVFDIALESGDAHGRLMLSLTPFRAVVKDYFLLCDSYYAALSEAKPARIEAIDIGRRGLHDEGSKLLMERLKGKIAIDFDTARRLFTLICALQMKQVGAAPTSKTQSVLFVCTRNAVRSPMAAALARHCLGPSVHVASAGLHYGEPDAFAAEVAAEIGAPIHAYMPRTIEDLADESFDLVVSLSPEARDVAVELGRARDIAVEHWPTMDPSETEGSRAQVLDAYRALRDALLARVKERFGA